MYIAHRLGGRIQMEEMMEKGKKILFVWVCLLLSWPLYRANEGWLISILLLGALYWGVCQMSWVKKKGYKIFFAILGFLPMAALILGTLSETVAGYTGWWGMFILRNFLLLISCTLGCITLVIAFLHSIFPIPKLLKIPA